MTRRAVADQGSILVDALVAIGVIGITLAFAAETVGGSALRTGAGERTRLAGLEARSRMAEVGGDIPLSPGQAGGEDGDLVWAVEIAPAASADTTHGASLMDVTVTVAMHGGPNLVTLHSLRIGDA